MQIIKDKQNSTIELYPFKDNEMSVIIYRQNGQWKVAWDETKQNMSLNETKIYNQTINLAIMMAETAIVDFD